MFYTRRCGSSSSSSHRRRRRRSSRSRGRRRWTGVEDRIKELDSSRDALAVPQKSIMLCFHSWSKLGLLIQRWQIYRKKEKGAAAFGTHTTDRSFASFITPCAISEFQSIVAGTAMYGNAYLAASRDTSRFKATCPPLSFDGQRRTADDGQQTSNDNARCFTLAEPKLVSAKQNRHLCVKKTATGGRRPEYVP